MRACTHFYDSIIIRHTNLTHDIDGLAILFRLLHGMQRSQLFRYQQINEQTNCPFNGSYFSFCSFFFVHFILLLARDQFFSFSVNTQCTFIFLFVMEIESVFFLSLAVIVVVNMLLLRLKGGQHKWEKRGARAREKLHIGYLESFNIVKFWIYIYLLLTWTLKLCSIIRDVFFSLVRNKWHVKKKCRLINKRQ